MKIESLLDFITKLEEMRKECNPEDMVRDSRGTYPKAEVLSNLISDAICAFDNNISLRNKGALAALQKDDHE